MIKVIDRYLLKYFLTSFLVVIVAFSLLIVVINMVEELRDFIDSRDSLICVFTRHDLERFDKLTSPGRENTILSRNIDRLVVLSIKRAEVVP